MRVELLFLRWVLIIAMVVLVVLYARSSGPDQGVARYETIPLIQGGRSSGMPLVGIAVDPQRRDIYAVVGGPTDKKKEQRFFIVWKGKEGGSYGTTFSSAEEGAEALCEITADGEARVLHNFSGKKPEATPDASQQTVSAEAALRSLLQALPSDSGYRAK